MGAPLLLTVVDVGIASLLLLVLRGLGLTVGGEPLFTPALVARAGPAGVWGGLFALVALQGLLHVAAFQSKYLLTEGAQLRMRLVLGRRLLPRTGAPPPLSRLGHLTGEVLPRASSFLFYGIQLLAFVAQAGTLALALIWVAPREAAVGLLGLAAAGAAVLSFSRRANRAAARVPASHLAFEESKVRAARSWLLIRALRLEEPERRRYVAACREMHRACVEGFFFANLGLAVTPLVALLVLAATALARERLFHTPVAAFVAFLYLFVRFQYLVAHGSHLVGNLFTSTPYLREAAELLAEVPPDDRAAALAGAAHARPAAAPSGPPPPPRLEARDLSFRWPGQERAVLEDLTVEVAAGEQLGIVGPNGCGKSTFLALVVGALEPDRGTLTLDGVDAAEWVTRYAAFLGYVGPEACLVAGTVRQNLCYGLERAPGDAELLGSLERAGFGDVSRRLPGGLDQVVREDGGGLSSGERQKLALARALLRRPALLLLDEPTANVDERSEAEIVDTLLALRESCTVVLVSHEPRVLRHADRRLSIAAEAGPRAA